MNNTPSFLRSPSGSTQSKVFTEHWDTVLDKFDNREHAEVLPNLLQYVNPELSKFADASGKKYEIPHGSVVVKIEQTENEIRVEAPFLDISESAKVPLMRQVANLNFHPLNMTKIVLDADDKLKFICNVPLDLNEPYKLYDIFREICINADKYDDEFIAKFKAKWLQEPKVTHYSESELDNYWNVFQQYLEEAQVYIDYFDSKRWSDFNYDVVKSTLMKLDYFCAPQGFLRSEIEGAIGDIDSRSPFNDRVHRGKEFLKKLRAMDKNTVLEDLYKAEVFIPYKYKSAIDNVRQNFEHAYHTAKDEISRRSFMGAYYTMYCNILSLFYYNNVDDALADLVATALNEASGISWEEGSTRLMELYKVIMEEEKYNAYLETYNA